MNIKKPFRRRKSDPFIDTLPFDPRPPPPIEPAPFPWKSLGVVILLLVSSAVFARRCYTLWGFNLTCASLLFLSSMCLISGTYHAWLFIEIWKGALPIEAIDDRFYW